MRNPEVRAIYICPEQNAWMQYRKEIMAEAGKGLVGDRYHLDIKKGYWQIGVPKPNEKIRHATLISEDAMEDTEFTEELTRRNIVVNMSVPELNSTVGQELQIGDDVRVRVTELCDPCRHPSDVSGIPGFASQYKGKGGVRVEILSPGIIKEGDPVVIFSS